MASDIDESVDADVRSLRKHITDMRKKLFLWKGSYKKHSSVKYGGVYSVFSFIFFSGRFCSPLRDKTKGIMDCVLCGAIGGDTPDHLVNDCGDQGVRKVMERAVVDLGFSLDVLKSRLLFLEDWSSADMGKPLSDRIVNGLSRVHCLLYRCRKRVRDELKRSGIAC